MEMDLKLFVGMEVDNYEEAWKFWVDYAKIVGFRARKEDKTPSRKDLNIVTSMRFTCAKHGAKRKKVGEKEVKKPRDETRCGCKVIIKFKRTKEGKYEVYDFVETHNHDLQTYETSHLLRSQRQITEVQASVIELAAEAGLKPKQTYNFLKTQAKGSKNVGCSYVDVNNKLRDNRKQEMAKGEVGALMQYFQMRQSENSSFFHTYDTDEDGKITNIFWADAKMLVDYSLFGDVLSLDTTFGTNDQNRPLAIFVGFNHYRGMVVFGAALLINETVDSFIWLFRTFLRAHQQKKPLTIFTDQDAAMARGLSEVMPDVVHALCTWHLMRNAPKHVGSLPKDGRNILSDLRKCMYENFNEEQFEEAWAEMLEWHNGHDNDWLKATYKLKRKWAACFIKQVFTGGMRSTQLSESINSDFKDVMHPNMRILEFFRTFDRLVEDKREKEAGCEFHSRQNISQRRNFACPILKQVVKVYTYPILELFQVEYDGMVSI